MHLSQDTYKADSLRDLVLPIVQHGTRILKTKTERQGHQIVVCDSDSTQTAIDLARQGNFVVNHEPGDSGPKFELFGKGAVLTADHHDPNARTLQDSVMKQGYGLIREIRHSHPDFLQLWLGERRSLECISVHAKAAVDQDEITLDTLLRNPYLVGLPSTEEFVTIGNQVDVFGGSLTGLNLTPAASNYFGAGTKLFDPTMKLRFQGDKVSAETIAQSIADASDRIRDYLLNPGDDDQGILKIPERKILGYSRDGYGVVVQTQTQLDRAIWDGPLQNCFIGIFLSAPPPPEEAFYVKRRIDGSWGVDEERYRQIMQFPRDERPFLQGTVMLNPNWFVQAPDIFSILPLLQVSNALKPGLPGQQLDGGRVCVGGFARGPVPGSDLPLGWWLDGIDVAARRQMDIVRQRLKGNSILKIAA